MENIIVIREITWNSQEYRATLALRERLLRAPLGLSFSDEEIENERFEHHIAAFQNDTLIGCCVLAPQPNRVIKMRQLVVETSRQNGGTGTRLVAFAEEFAKAKGNIAVILHARKTAVTFYIHRGYSVISEEFIEVTIPHYAMRKDVHFHSTITF